MTRPEEVRDCLDQYVEKELFSNIPKVSRPTKTNCKYYPTIHDLRIHISKTIVSQKYSSDDQESLKQKILEWEKQGKGKYFFRARSDGEKGKKEATEDKFLFVHQELWQDALEEIWLRIGTNGCYIQDHQVCNAPFLCLCPHQCGI